MKAANKEKLLKMWEEWCELFESDQVEETIDKENELIGQIEELMPFKNEEQHQHWLDVLFSFKFWEDFEELTLSIINQ